MAKKNAASAFLKNRDKWIRWVNNNPEVDHTVARVGVNLAMRMRSDQQFCWPTLKTISKDTGVSLRAVSSALDVLCGVDDRETGEVGTVYLIRTSRPNVGNIYAMFFPWLPHTNNCNDCSDGDAMVALE